MIQTLRKGPPFSVDIDLLSESMRLLYHYLPGRLPLLGGWGKFPAEERVWLLNEKSA